MKDFLVTDMFPPLYRFEGLTSKRLSPKIRGVILTISFYLQELEVLQNRIKFDVSKVFGKNKDRIYTTYFELLTDVHSYTIAWTNLDKSLRRLWQVTNDRHIELIITKRRKWFETMRRARNNIEHLDERAIKVPEIKNTPDILKVNGQKTAVIYNEKIDISENGKKRINGISKEIQNWLNNHIARND